MIGHGRQFTLTLFRREREGLEVGSPVEIIGDGVESRIAAVTGVSADGKLFDFAFGD